MRQLLPKILTVQASLFILLLTACKEDAEVTNTFCNLPARFTMQNTYQAPALYTACQSMGEFCTITISKDGNQFIIEGSKETDKVNINADAAYTGFNLGLSGLVVGLPNIPEMGRDYSVVTCYDLACSNCYETHHFAKKMTLREGTATCPSCHRTYNLNDRGIIATGEGGRSLYRYRTSYVGSTLVINNR